MIPTLYSKTSKGQDQQWTIFVDGPSFYVEEGIVGGKLTKTLPTVCKGKNLGRANATTPEQQALAEALAKHKKKLEAGYFLSIEEAATTEVFQCMLAEDYDDHYKGLPAYSQRKYDGIRCTATVQALLSRNNKLFTAVPHVHKALSEWFKADPTVRPDGELYCDKFANDFNAICSIVKRKNISEEEFEAAKVLQYHVYDISSKPGMPFSERTQYLAESLAKYCDPSIIVPVETTLCTTQAELDALYDQYIAEGYEGQMVRYDSPYENKRTKALLKRKEFKTDEFTILEVIPGVGNRTGTAGAMKLQDKAGKIFNSNIKGNRKHVTKLLEEAKTLIGQQATVRYFNLTPDGIPRFPFVIAIRNYE
jgi:DNA ligase-1